MTKVVNLFAGPGTGKSTTAALIFGQLKNLGVNAELVHEFAKDLTWEKRSNALKFTPYVLGKQAYHIHRLIDQVDVIVTDSPIIFCGHIYGKSSELGALALKLFSEWDTYNVFLQRDLKQRPYNPKGRTQTLNQAIELDAEIRNMLDNNNIDYITHNILADTSVADRIAHDVYYRLPK